MQIDAKLLERIGLALRELRRSQKLTQAELGKLSRVHCKFISLVERGKHNISILTLCQIVNTLGKDFVSFISDIDRHETK